MGTLGVVGATAVALALCSVVVALSLEQQAARGLGLQHAPAQQAQQQQQQQSGDDVNANADVQFHHHQHHALFAHSSMFAGLGDVLAAQAPTEPEPAPSGGVILSTLKSDDGRIQVLTLANDELFYKAQMYSNSARWTPWRRIGAKVPSYLIDPDAPEPSPAAAAAAGGSAAANQQPTGGTAAANGGPAAASMALNAEKRLMIFVRSATGQMQMRWEGVDAPCMFSKWHIIDGDIASSPVVFTREDGRVQAFAVGKDRALLTAKQASVDDERDWEAWSSMGGNLALRDTLNILVEKDQVSLFAVGKDGGLVRLSRKLHTNGGAGMDTWAAFESVGPRYYAKFRSRPSAQRDNTGGLVVFVLTEEHDAVSIAQSAAGSWGSWRLEEGKWQHAPQVSKHRDGRLVVFGVNAAGELKIKWQVTVPDHLGGKEGVEDVSAGSDNMHWSHWYTIPNRQDTNTFHSRPAVEPMANGHIEVLVDTHKAHLPVYQTFQKYDSGGFEELAMLLSSKHRSVPRGPGPASG